MRTFGNIIKAFLLIGILAPLAFADITETTGDVTGSSTGIVDPVGGGTGGGLTGFGSIGGWKVTRSTAQVCFDGLGCYYGGSGIAGATAGATAGLGFNGPFLSAQIDNAACRVLGIPEGSFGALIMVAAGLVAIVAGAMGSYKLAMSTIAIGAGAWILRPIVALFFPISCGSLAG